VLIYVRYLRVEMDDPTNGARYKKIFSDLQTRLSRVPAEDRSVSNSKHHLFMGVLTGASLHVTSTPKRSSRSMWEVLVAEGKFITGIMDCQRRSREAKGKKDAKEQYLRDSLRSNGFHKTLSGGACVPLPSAPKIMVTGVKPESARMFKSALYPALIEFIVDDSRSVKSNEHEKDEKPKRSSDLSLSIPSKDTPCTYKVIVKTGDDLRQDQLVIMMIFLMDGILKRGTLDLCLKPYSILATSQTSGLVEFVDGSIPISQILATYNNSVLQFLQKVAPCQNGSKYNVQPAVMQCYIRSCAGYCVITYLLGVGDRHLDNIMLQPSGHFFHIDFGFIFGRDPKPLPPAFRLTREVSNCCMLAMEFNIFIIMH